MKKIIFIFTILLSCSSFGFIGNMKLGYSVGITSLNVFSQFSDYSSYYLSNIGTSSITTEEKYSLGGIYTSVFAYLYETDSWSLKGSGGLSLLISSEYDYEVGIYEGSGDATAMELDISSIYAYHYNKFIDFKIKMGLSYLSIWASEPDERPLGSYRDWFYDGDFELGTMNAHFAPGISFKFQELFSIDAYYRILLANLSGYIDYGQNPQLEDLNITSYGIEVSMLF